MAWVVFSCQTEIKQHTNTLIAEQSIDSLRVEITKPIPLMFDTIISGVRIHSMDEIDDVSIKAIEFKENTFEKDHITIEVQKDSDVKAFYSVNNAEVLEFFSKNRIPLFEGNNVLLMFATNEKGISIKKKNTVYLKNHYSGDGSAHFDNSSPHLFYHLPKEAIYPMTDAGILLDFIVVNAEINKNAFSVEVFIDDLKFILPAWQAYRIEGLSEGKHRIKIRLIDKEGKWVLGPFNDSAYRTFEIKKES